MLLASVFGGSASPADAAIAAERADQVGVVELGLAATTTTLSSTENPAPLGATVTYTAVVAPVQGTGTPTGNVEFYGGPSPVMDPINVPVSVVAGRVEATLSAEALDFGTQTIYARYSGDTNFAGSDAVPLSETIARAGTTPTATTTTTVTVDSNSVTVGQSVTFTAVVTPAPGAGTPTGSVQFSGRNGVVLDPIDVPVEVVGGQVEATFTVTAIEPGTLTIYASYNGDTNFAGSAAAPLAVTVNSTTTPTPTPTPTPTSTSTPPQSPSIAGVQRSGQGVASITLGFSEALNPGSADKAHLYRLLGAVRQQGKEVFRTPVAIKHVRYTATTQSVTITLAKPHKGALHLEIKAGLTAANGASSPSAFLLNIA